MGPRRLLGWLAAAGPLVFTAAWVIAAAMQSGYDPLRDDESALAALGADHPWVTMTGDLLLGAAIVVLAAGLASALPGRDVDVGCWLLLAAGLATAVQALARADCPTQLGSCAARDPSWHQAVHDTAAGVAFFTLLAASLVLARPFRSNRHWQSLATYSVITAATGLLLLVAYAGTADSSWGGLTERAFLAVPLTWITIVGIRLSQSRIPPTIGAPVYQQISRRHKGSP